MNYRHAYHAGNHADVLKHAVLALVLEHMKLKPQPFRVIDTHAGTGHYDLTAEEARRTGEWRDGIGRLLAPEAGAVALPEEAARLLAPYLEAVRAANPGGGLAVYPGSPWLARRLMRPGDPLVANELHPEDAALLRGHMSRMPDTKVLEIDAYIALKSLLPPKERRGVILIDPPYEVPGELARLVKGLDEATRRFATGVFLIWYPIKGLAAVRAFHRDLAALGRPKLLAAELLIRDPADESLLNGSGLAILNPPWRLDEALAVVLPALAASLAQGPGARHELAWIAGETAGATA